MHPPVARFDPTEFWLWTCIGVLLIGLSFLVYSGPLTFASQIVSDLFRWVLPCWVLVLRRSLADTLHLWITTFPPMFPPTIASQFVSGSVVWVLGQSYSAIRLCWSTWFFLADGSFGLVTYILPSYIPLHLTIASQFCQVCSVM